MNKNLMTIIILIILVIGVIIGVVLVRNPQIFNPQADEALPELPLLSPPPVEQ